MSDTVDLFTSAEEAFSWYSRYLYSNGKGGGRGVSVPKVKRPCSPVDIGRCVEFLKESSQISRDQHAALIKASKANGEIPVAFTAYEVGKFDSAMIKLDLHLRRKGWVFDPEPELTIDALAQDIILQKDWIKEELSKIGVMTASIRRRENAVKRMQAEHSVMQGTGG